MKHDEVAGALSSTPFFERSPSTLHRLNQFAYLLFGGVLAGDAQFDSDPLMEPFGQRLAHAPGDDFTDFGHPLRRRIQVAGGDHSADQ